MKVYTLVGKSGTGKSYQSLNLCKDLDIEAIIDDGLFIYNNRVVAGTSAKRDRTKVGAIKTALFHKDELRDMVVSALARINPKSILVIATSDKMAERIITRLSLPDPIRRIYIEDISTAEDMAKAHKQRNTMGKHVIPVPTLQIKQDFAGYFVDALQVFRDITGSTFGMGKSRKPAMRDLSVVRPTYNYLGEFFISEKVIMDIARCVGGMTQGVKQVSKVYGNTDIEDMIITCGIIVDKSLDPMKVAEMFQLRVFQMVETMTAFNVRSVRVEVRGVR